DYTLEVHRTHFAEPIGSATVRVAEYRQPALRVDVDAVTTDLCDDDAFDAHVQARYLFGAPAAGAHAVWRLTRRPGGTYPVRWQPYTFAPADAAPHDGTVASGDVPLDAQGAADVHSRVALDAAVRARTS